MGVNHQHQRITKIYLIRHGQTAYNVDDRLRGRADPALTDLGREQAAALGGLFAGVPLSRVLSSPLQRAIDTARPVARAAGLPVEADEALNDRDYGPWTGTSHATVLQRFGSLDAAPGVESWEALRQRVTRAFEAILATANGPAIALVGHDATNRALLASLVAELSAQPDQIQQANGCWNRLDWEDGRWVLTVLNATPQDRQHP